MDTLNKALWAGQVQCLTHIEHGNADFFPPGTEEQGGEKDYGNERLPKS